MSDKKEDVDSEMLKNLDILMDLDIFEAEDDWTHLEDDTEKDKKNDKT